MPRKSGPSGDSNSSRRIPRASPEWDDVYSMVMTDSCGAAAECHDRMPVLLTARDYGAWLGGTAAEAKALCVPYAGPVAVERTGEMWAAR